jgi:hypothetical protein
MSTRSITPRSRARSRSGSRSRRRAARRRLQRLERAEEVGALAVEHVDEQQARDVELGGARFHSRVVVTSTPITALTTKIADSQTRSAPSASAMKLGRRGVDQVDLALLPLERGERRRDRHLARLLVGVGVRHGRAVDDAAEPVDRAGLEQQRLVQRGLPATAVADERHVANPIRGLVHATPLSPRGRETRQR